MRSIRKALLVVLCCIAAHCVCGRPTMAQARAGAPFTLVRPLDGAEYFVNDYSEAYPVTFETSNQMVKVDGLPANQSITVTWDMSIGNDTGAADWDSGTNQNVQADMNGHWERLAHVSAGSLWGVIWCYPNAYQVTGEGYMAVNSPAAYSCYQWLPITRTWYMVGIG